MNKDNSNRGPISRNLIYLAFNVLFFLVVLTNQAQSAVTLKFVLTYPQDHPWSIASAKFANEVEKISKGNIVIKMFPPGTLVPPDKPLEALKAGMVEMANSNTNLLSRYVKPMELFNLPFLFRDLGQAEDFLTSSIGEKLLAEEKSAGLIGLSFLMLLAVPVLALQRTSIWQCRDLRRDNEPTIE